MHKCCLYLCSATEVRAKAVMVCLVLGSKAALWVAVLQGWLL